MFEILRFLKRSGRPEGRTAKRRQRVPARGACGRRLVCEALEARTLLSGVPELPVGWQAKPLADPVLFSNPDASGSAIPYGLTPNQVRGAYGLGTYTSKVLSNGIAFAGIAGDGRGQTIAIVDAYDDPNAASDLNAFSTYYGLPTFGGAGNPTFQKLDQNGGSSLPSAGGGWTEEESLDIEWAHVMAPMANIILFEAADIGNGLYTAAQTAANTPGVVAVSMSWSGNEFSGETGYDSTYFVTPSGHLGGANPLGGANLFGGVTFLAATGDYGAYVSGSSAIKPQYPACSPNVVAVGGTSLYPSGNSYGSETAWGCGTNSWEPENVSNPYVWGGGGGGISAYETQPSYQTGVVAEYNTSISTTKRDYPDVSADANPYTGVPIYDTYDFGSATPWLYGYEGGTSLACPLWAGMIAVADEGRAIAGQGSLYSTSQIAGANQTLPALYKMPAADLHDITYDSSTTSTYGNTMPGPNTGPSPTYSPGAGYDLATGLGSPVGNLLIPQLAGPSVVMGAAAWPGSTTVNLSVLGADSGGESSLTYTWVATAYPGASAPTFSGNGSNAAKNTTATLSGGAGTYGFTVTITDAVGLSVTSSATVTVAGNQSQTTSFDVTALPLTATALDQFGTPLASQPQAPWSVDGNGGVDFNSTTGGAVTLDGVNPSFTGMTFSAGNYTIGQQGSGGTLQLDNAASAATLTVAAGQDTIDAPVALNSSATILPAAGSQLTISGGVSGAGGLTINDQGTVVLTGANSYAGGTTVLAGTLVLASPSAIATGTSLMIGTGDVFDFGLSTPEVTPSAVVSAISPLIAGAAMPPASLPSPSGRGAGGEGGSVEGGSAMTAHSFTASVSIKNPIASPENASAASAAPAADSLAGPSIPKRIAADLSWFGQAGNGSDAADQQHKKDVAILAREAVFAQYDQ